MPDPWAGWDAKVDATGRPSRVCEDLDDLELLILLADAAPDRAFEKQIIQQEVYRRMGHEDAARPSELRRDQPREFPTPQSFSRLPMKGDRVDPF